MTNEIETLSPSVPAMPRSATSQATAVEQQRAVAEVQAMVVVAQQVPRDLTKAVDQMRESCNMKALAQRAFFRFPRGGQQITGPSVHLARELARCFGNVTYGLTELRRDDDEGVSEMQAFAWDLETNTRTSSTFMVPHRRDTRGGPQALVDTRDIYENNANQGARRVREAIFAVLPPWYVEEAKALCSAALERDEDGKPLATRIANTVNAFERKFQVTVDQLEAKLGRKRKDWQAVDLATLEVIGASLGRGEVTIDEEFEPRRVTAADIIQQGSSGGGEVAATGNAGAEPPPEDAGVVSGESASDRQPESAPRSAAPAKGGEGGGPTSPAPNGEGEPQEAATAVDPGSPSSGPDDRAETWQEHAARLDVKTVDLLRAIKALWPKNSEWDLPSNRTQIQAAYERDAESAQRIHDAIDQAAAKAGES